MRFANDRTKAEYLRVHPATRAAGTLFEDWSTHQALPEPLITDVMDDGRLGRKPESWHMPHRLTATDYEVAIYTGAQLQRAESWFVRMFAKPMWELITKPHGTGPHIHLARRDWNYQPPAAVVA